MDLISLLIYILVVALVFGLVWWIVGLVPLPEPFGKIVRVVLIVIGVLVVVDLLLGLAGHPFVTMPLRMR